MPDRRFTEQVAVVTGAGSGIGAAIVAGLLADDAAAVIVNDLSADELAPWAGEPRCVPVPGDTADPQTAEALAAAAPDGRVDMLFNNAGVYYPSAAEDHPHDAWRRTVDVNLSAVFYIAQAIGRLMIARRSGAIVNTASSAGLLGIPNNLSYNATKHGVVGLTKALAVEWARYGIRVNALCPGLTDTEMVRVARTNDPERFAAREAKVPLARTAAAAEQAAVALFAGSDAASYLTGVALPVDGGTGALSSGYDAPRV